MKKSDKEHPYIEIFELHNINFFKCFQNKFNDFSMVTIMTTVIMFIDIHKQYT